MEVVKLAKEVPSLQMIVQARLNAMNLTCSHTLARSKNREEGMNLEII